MKPSTWLLIGVAPSLILRDSSSPMPPLAVPCRMAAYMGNPAAPVAAAPRAGAYAVRQHRTIVEVPFAAGWNPKLHGLATKPDHRPASDSIGPKPMTKAFAA